ncbi:DUF397 domain-containing protein [Actinocorallia aurantiaca]|uniref:DUF397 domain-containing protein n=1 Tax=Actinocorallia aurantiaca TaxID=46204 RepID=A0ABN3U8N6_9ACTN
MKSPQWRKSSYSMTSAESDCVELAGLPTGIGVRDSKRPHTGHLSLDRDRFAGLLRRLKEMP